MCSWPDGRLAGAGWAKMASFTSLVVVWVLLWSNALTGGLARWHSGKELKKYMGSIPGSGRSLGVGNGNPFQNYCLENSMHRGTWRATVHGVTKRWTWLSTEYTHSALTGPYIFSHPISSTRFIPKFQGSKRKQSHNACWDVAGIENNFPFSTFYWWKKTAIPAHI